MKLVRLTRRPNEVVEIPDNEFDDARRWGQIIEVVESDESVTQQTSKKNTDSSKARS